MTATSPTSSLVARLRRRERWLMALAAVRAELLSGGTAAEAMALIASRCAALAEADGALILLADDAGDLTVWAASGPLADIDSGPAELAAADADEPWTAAIRPALGVHHASEFPVPRHDGLARIWTAADSVVAASIPARGSDGAGGVVICLRSVGRPAFEPESEPELVGLAEQASIALDVVGRAERRRLAELMADRERIARDLHDHVIQRLFAVGLSLQGQLRHIDDDAARDRVDHAVGEIDEAIAELRSSIFDLRASADGRTSLRRRLGEIVAGANRTDEHGRRVTLRYQGPIDTMVGPDLAAEVEAVVREAVSNAVKHSGADAIAVTVSAADDLQVTVADNGCGMPDTVVRSGLKNLAERAESCGGALHVESVIRHADAASAADGGTTIRWVVPL